MTKFFFQGAFRCQTCHKFRKKKNDTGIRPKCKRIFNWQLLKLWEHLIKPSTTQRHRGARSLFCVLSYKNDIRHNCEISNFSYHLGGTCPVKEFSWSRNGAFFGTKKRPRRTSQGLEVEELCFWITSSIVFSQDGIHRKHNNPGGSATCKREQTHRATTQTTEKPLIKENNMSNMIYSLLLRRDFLI